MRVVRLICGVLLGTLFYFGSIAIGAICGGAIGSSIGWHFGDPENWDDIAGGAMGMWLGAMLFALGASFVGARIMDYFDGRAH